MEQEHTDLGNPLIDPSSQENHPSLPQQPTRTEPSEVVANISRHSPALFPNIATYYQAPITDITDKTALACVIHSNIDLSVIDEKIKSITQLALITIVLFSFFNVVNNWFSLFKVLPELAAVILGFFGTLATPICCTASKAITLLEVGITLTAKQQTFFNDIRPKLKKFINEIKKLPTQQEREQAVSLLMPVIQISQKTYLDLIKDDPKSWRRRLLPKKVTANTTFEYALEILVRELSEDYPLELIICIGQGPTQKLWDTIHLPSAEAPTTDDIEKIVIVPLTARELNQTPFLVEGRRWIFFGDQPDNLILPTGVCIPVNASWSNWVLSGQFIKDFFTKAAPFFCLRLIPYVITVLQAGQSAMTIVRKLAGISEDAPLSTLDAITFFFTMVLLGWPKARTNDPFKGVPAVEKLEGLGRSSLNNLSHISIENLTRISFEDLHQNFNTWTANGRPVEPLLPMLTFLLTFILSAGPIAAVTVYYAGLGLFFSESGLITLSKILTIPIDNDIAKEILAAISDVCAFSFAAQGILTQCFDTWDKFYDIADKLIKSMMRRLNSEEPSGNILKEIISTAASLSTYLIDTIVLSFFIDSSLFGVNAAFSTEVMGERIDLVAHVIRLCMILSGAFVGVSAVLFSIVRYEDKQELLDRFVKSFDMKSTCTCLCSFWPCVEKPIIGDLANSRSEQLENVVWSNRGGESLLGNHDDPYGSAQYQAPPSNALGFVSK
jgi:hypothetical protein